MITALSRFTGGTAQAQMLPTVSSEEVRLADIGRGNLPIHVGQQLRMIGKVRSLKVGDDGRPQITFTGVEASLGPAISKSRVEEIEPDTFVAVECTRSKPKNSIFALMDACTKVDPVLYVTSDAYKAAYDANVFRADTRFKGKEIVISGLVRLVNKLNSGETYVSFDTQNGFSDVVAALAPNSIRLVSDYAKVGQQAFAVCRSGYHYNLAGSVGLDRCRFLQNY